MKAKGNKHFLFCPSSKDYDEIIVAKLHNGWSQNFVVTVIDTNVAGTMECNNMFVALTWYSSTLTFSGLSSGNTLLPGKSSNCTSISLHLTAACSTT